MPLSSADGYGYSGEELVLAASDLGAEIGVYAHDWQEPFCTDPRLLEMKLDSWTNYDLGVVYFIPYAFHHFRCKFQIGMTMFETTQIPDTWAKFCTLPNALIVPSTFCKEAFEKKVAKPIYVAPLGVNTKTYPYLEREPSQVFTFLMAGLLHYRKGTEFAVRAFKEEFSEKEPVRLLLKTRKNFLDIGDQELRDDIEVVNWNYSRDEMLDLYHAADCFLAPSRGEASGLTPREALSTGLPIIATNWSGLSEICDERFVYPLSIEGLDEAPVVCSSYSEGITQGESIGDFSIPSVTHLRQLMRHVYENREESLSKGKAGASWVKENWSYQKCAKIWLDTIEEIYETHR